MSSEINVLLVDDKKENLLALENVLKDEGVKIYTADSGRAALELLLVRGFAVALVDVQMPDMNGFELAELMRSRELTKSIPIIFVTAGAMDAASTFHGYEVGAVDFLYKPLDMRVVKSKVRIFKELQEQKLLVMEQFGRLAEAMRWKDDFLSIASHELKTPITSIRLNLQIAEKQFSDDVAQPLPPDKMKRIFSATYSQFNKLTRLIDDLLDTTRIRAGKLTVELELADLSKLVKDVVERFLPELQNVRCPLRLAIEEGIVVRCDPFRTEQVLANLLSNVVKYAPGRPVTLSLSGTDAGARLSVKDQGPGIPANEVNSVFERFERGQNSGKGISGLGLGLYIVKQIIEAHSGSITLETTEGSGSEFIVIFPCIHIM